MDKESQRVYLAIYFRNYTRTEKELLIEDLYGIVVIYLQLSITKYFNKRRFTSLWPGDLHNTKIGSKIMEVPSMYRIAICDDEKAEVVKTQEMLNNYRKVHPELDFEIGIFENANNLLLKVQEGYAPDLILMDIYMDGKTGIEAAEELHEMGNKSRVLFLTTSQDHALEAFQVDAVQYLVKPVSETKLFPLLDKQIEVLDYEKQKYVTLETDNRTYRVMVRDIVYCESQRKTQYLHLTDGTQLCVRMPMTGLEKLFLPYAGIIRIGKWYIINISHVASLDSQTVQMDNGQKLYLPRGAYQSLRKQYITYYTGVLS